LLEAASDLFYRLGITAVGVDALSEAAHVSKRSLYQHFGSKDELVAEALRTRAPAIMARWLAAVDASARPRERILTVFETLRTLSLAPGFRGCPFVNVATELVDPTHPARAVARAAKQALHDFFRDNAAEAGAHHPDTLADQLTMLFDGAMAQRLVGLDIDPAAAAQAAAVLIDSAMAASR
jgi:AcrR family transcriptional regulator